LALPRRARRRSSARARAGSSRARSAQPGRGLARHGIPWSKSRGFPEQLGDFRLLEPLGGEHGVVYLAVQTSLQRDVALKLIRPEHLYFTGARARFRREPRQSRDSSIRASSDLRVGEDQGIPYFAMELVRGCTLAEALRALRGRRPKA